MSGSPFRHEALFYGSDEEFLAGTVFLLGEAVDAGGCGLVAVRREKAELLRGELGEYADAVDFLDMEALGRNPGRIIAAWREFLDRTAEVGAPVCGIGEPAWPARAPVELDECHRHEALLNVAFDSEREWTLLCPYDTEGLDSEVLAAALETHPHVRRGAASTECSGWRGMSETFSPFDGDLPATVAGATTIAFERDQLAAVRELVSDEAVRASLSGERRVALTIAVNELAANCVLHGGGAGTVQVWLEPDAVVAEVRDEGWIKDPLAGRLRPEPSQEHGRGLWMVNQLCDLVQIRSGVSGTRVRIRVGLE